MPPTPNRPGVYQILNSRDGKRYVGSGARSILVRLIQHKSCLRGGYHINRHLQGSWNYFGEENFKFLSILNCSPKWCLCLEQIEIAKHKSLDESRGFNMAPVAGSMLGFHHSEKTREAIRKAHTGRKRVFSDEKKLAISLAMRARKYSPEVCKRNSDRQKGKKLPEWLREKIAAAMRSPELKAKIAATKKLNPYIYTDEQRLRRSVSMKGRKFTQEHKDKIGASHRGRIVTEETKRKMKESSRLRWLRHYAEKTK